LDLKSGYPWWAVRNGLMHTFPALQEDLRCDVAIVGGGITAALIANELATHGHEVAVLERRDIGWGSTSASTAMLQYEIDTHLVDLTRDYGEEQSVRAYRACADAIPQLRDLGKSLREVDWAPLDSLYLASRERDSKPLQEEFALRQAHEFPVEWLPRSEVMRRYAIDAPCAILSRLGARIDPYRFTSRLLSRLQGDGVGVYDRSDVVDIACTSRGVTLRTDGGATVRARHVVLAAGYESQRWLKKRVARNHSSYAYISDPLDPEALGYLRKTMLWESARPYVYLRSTGDDRVLVGGEDDDVDVPARRDARVDKKAKVLQKRVAKLLPGFNLQPAFAWAGTFAETDDGLPIFGSHAGTGPRMQFAMAYGGNGITYSMAGAALIRAQIERRKHPLQTIFGFERLG
jgi:glycine/D-amino acid oxidase-like deaminating enzyme